MRAQFNTSVSELCIGEHLSQIGLYAFFTLFVLGDHGFDRVLLHEQRSGLLLEHRRITRTFEWSFHAYNLLSSNIFPLIISFFLAGSIQDAVTDCPLRYLFGTCICSNTLHIWAKLGNAKLQRRRIYHIVGHYSSGEQTSITCSTSFSNMAWHGRSRRRLDPTDYRI
jgi:hypothetical protein